MEYNFHFGVFRPPLKKKSELTLSLHDNESHFLHFLLFIH